MRAYEYRHVVGFEETNLVGNVYYVNHLRWQGRCREMFFREHAPGVLRALAKDLALATVRCSCDYLRELDAFDEIVLRMRLASAQQHRLSMEFEYWRQTAAGEELVARGAQRSPACAATEVRQCQPPCRKSYRRPCRPFPGHSERGSLSRIYRSRRRVKPKRDGMGAAKSEAISAVNGVGSIPSPLRPGPGRRKGHRRASRN